MCRSLFTSFLLLASASAAAIQSNWTAPADVSTKVAADASSFWLEDIKHQGLAAFNSDPSSYVVFRNVMDYGAKGIYTLLLFLYIRIITNQR